MFFYSLKDRAKGEHIYIYSVNIMQTNKDEKENNRIFSKLQNIAAKFRRSFEV